MRHKSILIWLLSLGFVYQEKETPRGQEWDEAETEHYKIHCQAGEEVLKEYKEKMEILYKFYADLFKYDKELKEKLVVRLYKDKKSYMAGGNSGSTGGMYNPKTNVLSCYNRKELLNYAAHEGAHQFTDVIFPKGVMAIPGWFNEGIGNCIGSCKIVDGKLKICLLKSYISQNMLIGVKQFKDKFIPLKEFLKVPADQFMKKPQIYYPQSWTFFHFLWNYPELEGTKGKYAGVISSLIEAYKGGKGNDEAYDAAFKDLDLDTLEKEWKEYIPKLK